MRELGFSYDPSTAGSSVRFDPPNPNDRVCLTFAIVTNALITFFVLSYSSP